jgi:hypothetical protein
MPVTKKLREHIELLENIILIENEFSFVEDMIKKLMLPSKYFQRIREESTMPQDLTVPILIVISQIKIIALMIKAIHSIMILVLNLIIMIMIQTVTTIIKQRNRRTSNS